MLEQILHHKIVMIKAQLTFVLSMFVIAASLMGRVGVEMEKAANIHTKKHRHVNGVKIAD